MQMSQTPPCKWSHEESRVISLMFVIESMTTHEKLGEILGIAGGNEEGKEVRLR